MATRETTTLAECHSGCKTVQAETGKPKEGMQYRAVETDQSTIENFDKSDYLWFFEKDFVPNDKLKDKKININFKHGLSLFDIQITYGTEFNASTLLDVSEISNMKVKGSVIGFGPIFGDSFRIKQIGSEESIAPYHSGFTAATTQAAHAVDNFSCILVPQDISAGNFSVEFVAKGKFYQWTSTTDIKLEPGKKYQLNLVLGKELLMAGSITPKAWTNQAEGNIETE